jgi:hypothetical protein
VVAKLIQFFPKLKKKDYTHNGGQQRKSKEKRREKNDRAKVKKNKEVKRRKRS